MKAPNKALATFFTIATGDIFVRKYNMIKLKITRVNHTNERISHRKSKL